MGWAPRIREGTGRGGITPILTFPHRRGKGFAGEVGDHEGRPYGWVFWIPAPVSEHEGRLFAGMTVGCWVGGLDGGAAFVEVGVLLVGVAGAEDYVFFHGASEDLEAEGEAVLEAAGD